jgi:uncharacterized protein with HEPN domain
MPSKTSAQRLRDILDNIDLVGTFTSGLAYTDFESDRKTVYAGNVYRHEYEGIDEALIWYTAQSGTQALRRMAAEELALLSSAEGE